MRGNGNGSRTTKPFGPAVASLSLMILAAGCTSAKAAPSAAPKTSSPASAEPAAAPATSNPVSSGPCSAYQLDIGVEPLPGAAAGTTYSTIVVSNHSSAPCTMTGPAEVTFADAGHHAIPVSVTPAVTGSSLVLDPGGSAAEKVGYGSDGNPPPGRATCDTTVSFIEVTVPGGLAPQEFPFAARPFCPDDRVSVDGLVTVTR